MRWIDLATEPARRTLATWREAMRRDAAQTVLDDIVARSGRRTPGGTPLVVLATGALRTAWDHVAASPLERGGLLVGEPLLRGAGDTEPSAVYVRAAVPGLDGDATGYSLRLGTGVWDAARSALGPGEVVVGWFHSHPDLGAFFSGTDRRTQAGFFPHPFSLGWVIDPVRGEEAWFAGPHSIEIPVGEVATVG